MTTTKLIAALAALFTGAAHNTFDNPDNVCPVDLRSISLKKGVLTFKLPANSVVVVELVK